MRNWCKFPYTETGKCNLSFKELVQIRLTRSDPAPNTWLCWTIDELAEFSMGYGIDQIKAFEVNITRFGETIQDLIWDQSFGFHRPFKE